MSEHQIRCKGIIYDDGAKLIELACDCGMTWLQPAIDAPHSSSLVKCECGARAWFDLRTDDQKRIDAGGAP